MTDSLFELHSASRSVDDVAVSDDGRVAFVTTEVTDGGDERQVLSVETDDGFRSVARSTRVDSLRWSPTGDRLGFVVRGSPTPGDSANGGSRQLWMLAVSAPGDLHQITTLDGTVKSFDWHSDGRRVVVEAERRIEDDDEVFATESREYVQSLNGLGAAESHLYVCAVDGDERRRLNVESGASHLHGLTGFRPRWGPTPGEISYVAHESSETDHPNVTDVFALRLDDGRTRKLTDSDRFVPEFEWSGDGDRLAYLARPPSNIYVDSELRLRESDGRHRTLALDGWVRGCSWGDDGSLVVRTTTAGRDAVSLVDRDGGVDPLAVPARPERSGVACFDASADGIVAAITSPENHVRIVEACVDGEETTTRATVGEGFDLDPPRRIGVESDDGTDVDAYVYLPSDYDPEADPARPTVVRLFGSGAVATPDFEFERLHLLDSGYVVVEPNHRGVISYGREFAHTGYLNLESEGVADVSAVVADLAERGWVDEECVYAKGYSRGALLVAYLLARTEQFAGGAVDRGPYDFASLYGTSVQDGVLERNFGLPWEEDDRYREVSVLNEITDIEAPLLIFACEYDSYAPVSQATQLYGRLREREVPARLVVYRDQRHLLHKPEHRLHRIAETVEWFDRHRT